MASNQNSDYPLPQLSSFMPSAAAQQLDAAAYTNPRLSLAARIATLQDQEGQQQYQGALQQALQQRALADQQARNTDVMKTLINQAPAYGKQGLPIGLLGMYGNMAGANITPGAIDLMQQLGLPATTMSLNTQAAQAANQRAQSVKTLSDAGFKQLAPGNIVDVLNQAPLTPYVNPGDRASMIAANNAGKSGSSDKPPSLMLPIPTPSGATAMIRFPNAAQATPGVINAYQQQLGRNVNNKNPAANQAKTPTNVQAHMKSMLDDQELAGHGAQPLSQNMNDDGTLTATYGYADGRTATYNIDQNGNVLAQ